MFIRSGDSGDNAGTGEIQPYPLTHMRTNVDSHCLKWSSPEFYHLNASLPHLYTNM